MPSCRHVQRTFTLHHRCPMIYISIYNLYIYIDDVERKQQLIESDITCYDCLDSDDKETTFVFVFTNPADLCQADARTTKYCQLQNRERRATATVMVTTTLQHHSESPCPCDSIHPEARSQCQRRWHIDISTLDTTIYIYLHCDTSQ